MAVLIFGRSARASPVLDTLQKLLQTRGFESTLIRPLAVEIGEIRRRRYR